MPDLLWRAGTIGRPKSSVAVHTAGGLVALQLFHAGRYASRSAFGLDPVAHSAVPSRFSPDPPRALTAAEASATAEEFGRGRQSRPRQASTQWS